jgi:hypothetical protein
MDVSTSQNIGALYSSWDRASLMFSQYMTPFGLSLSKPFGKLRTGSLQALRQAQGERIGNCREIGKDQ